MVCGVNIFLNCGAIYRTNNVNVNSSVCRYGPSRGRVLDFLLFQYAFYLIYPQVFSRKNNNNTLSAYIYFLTYSFFDAARCVVFCNGNTERVVLFSLGEFLSRLFVCR
jgi:hypothetical protein